MRSQLVEVIRREIVTRIRTRGFQGITALLALLAIAGPVAAAVWPDANDEARDVVVGLGDGLPAAFESVVLALSGDEFDVEFVPLDGNAAEDLLSDDTIDVAVEGGPTLVWDRRSDFGVEGLLSNALNQVELLERAEAQGLDADELGALLQPVQIEERFAAGDSTDEDVRTAVSFGGLMLAFMLPLIFGQFTMMSVIEEKSTRVIEVLLSQLRPRTLLTGKVIGISVLALIQLVLVFAGTIAGLLIVDRFDVPASVWRFVPILAISLLAGLVLYNTFFALLGSLISRQEDQQQVVFPAMAPIMLGYFVGQAAIFGSADSLLMRVLTWFPLTAPMLLPVRVAQEAIEPWEVIVSLALLVLAIALMLRLAARVYEFSLLRVGERMRWSELWARLRGTTTD